MLFELGIILPIGLRTLGMTMTQLVRESLIPFALPLIGLWVYSDQLSRHFPNHHNWPALIAITCGGGAVMGVVWLAQQLLERATTPRTTAAG